MHRAGRCDWVVLGIPRNVLGQTARYAQLRCERGDDAALRDDCVDGWFAETRVHFARIRAERMPVQDKRAPWAWFGFGVTLSAETPASDHFRKTVQPLLSKYCYDCHADGAAVARHLALTCDVLIEGFRPGVAARLGIGYEALAKDNPGLIYLSISGFGQSGPYAQRPGSDSVAQAFSGLVSVNVGNDKFPHRVGTTISDVATGVYAFQAIATTLFARTTVGSGRWIDVNLCQSTSALLGHKVAEFILEGGAPRAVNVPAGTYQTQDGWMMVTLVN